jgi:hypothetical protein
VKMWRHWYCLGASVVSCMLSLPHGVFVVQSLRKRRDESGLRVLLFVVAKRAAEK